QRAISSGPRSRRSLSSREGKYGAGLHRLHAYGVRVLPANLFNPRVSCFLVEMADRVAAQQRKFVVARQLVPQNLQPNRPVFVAFLPEQVDHFAVGTDGTWATVDAHPVDEIPHVASEEQGIRYAVHHEG